MPANAAVVVENLTLNQGETPQPIHFVFRNGTGGDLNLEGYTLYSEIRPSRNSRNVMATFTLAFEGPASEGRVELQITREESSKLFRSGVYDVWAEHPTLGEIPLVEGTVTVRSRISPRPEA